VTLVEAQYVGSRRVSGIRFTMRPNDRRELIVSRMREHERVTVEFLAKDLSTSSEDHPSRSNGARQRARALISGGVKMRLQTQITNLMNHPNFGNPVTNLTSPTYGRIISLATANYLGPRRAFGFTSGILRTSEALPDGCTWKPAPRQIVRKRYCNQD